MTRQQYIVSREVYDSQDEDQNFGSYGYQLIEEYFDITNIEYYDIIEIEFDCSMSNQCDLLDEYYK